MGGVWRKRGPCACPPCSPAPPPLLVRSDNGRCVAEAGALCLSPSCWVATNAPHGKPTESPSPLLVRRDNERCWADARPCACPACSPAPPSPCACPACSSAPPHLVRRDNERCVAEAGA